MSDLDDCIAVLQQQDGFYIGYSNKPQMTAMGVNAPEAMRKVLHAFFSGEEPYRLYAKVVDGDDEQQDRAFDEDVKMLRDLLRATERKKEAENRG